VELLRGCGLMLQSIDAKIEKAVALLGGDEDEEDQP
jgi:hypothetical protein